MTFLYPQVLLLLILPLITGVWGVVQRYRAGTTWRALVSPEHAEELVVSRPVWKSYLSTALLTAALICIITAAARPILGYTEATTTMNGRNLLIALDVSRSMETDDVKPSRLAEARTAAFELIDALPEDRIGLMVFSGDADLVVPLTYDHAVLRDTLQQVDRTWASHGGTNLGRLLEKALQDFRRSASGETNALVILSDGEDTVDTDREQLLSLAEQNKLLVITVGIGTTTGAAIPDAGGENGLWQNAEGKHVISKLDEESLQRFAEQTGGSYFSMSGGTDLRAFARDAVRRINRHEEEFSAGKIPNDIFSYFALPALILLAVVILLNTDRRGFRRAVGTVILSLLCFAPAAQAEDAAEATAESAVSRMEDLPALSGYERALEQMKKGNTQQAHELLSAALLKGNEDLQAASHYALGNLNNQEIFGELRKLYGGENEEADAGEEQAQPAEPSPESIRNIVSRLRKNLVFYDDALKLNPGLEQAAENKKRVEELIKRLEKDAEQRKEQQQKENEQQKQQNESNPQGQQDQDKQEQSDDGKQDGGDKGDSPENNENDGENKDRDDGTPDQQEQKDDSDKPDNQSRQQDDKQQDDSRDQDKQQQDKQQQDKQNKQQSRGSEDGKNGQEPQQQQQPQPQKAQVQLSDEKREQQRAEAILRMHLDEEKGSPIPHGGAPAVLKDY